MVVKRLNTQRTDPTGNREEMNVDSIKLEEQGTSWSLQLKEEDACGAPVSPSQAHADDVDCNVEDKDWLPSIGLKAEPVSPIQSDDDSADRKEEWNEAGGARLPSNGLEAESAQESHSCVSTFQSLCILFLNSFSLIPNLLFINALGGE